MAELFAELQKAFEVNDEPKALLLKSEIDRLKEKMIAREQVRQARKAEKTKEKKAAKLAKKAAAVAEKEAATGKSAASTSKTTTGAAKSGAAAKKGAKTTAAKSVPKKPLDTPDTIAVKLQSRFPLDPSKLINPPADSGRKCLVLDIDYTLFDHKWQPQVRSDLRSNKTMIPLFKRPYLHEFLATCNLKYDIIIWSATGMPAIDNKVGNLGIYTSDRYKLTAVLCKDHMIHVTRPRKGGRTYDETVKPLEVIWKKFPEYYNPTNTIHIDDMISNFQLNPLNGVHISPYKESATATLPDTELQYLTKYLMLIAETEPDFTKLPHSKWKEWLIDRLWQDSLLTVNLPIHTPDPPIDAALLIASEIASKPKKGAAAAAAAAAAASAGAQAASGLASGATTSTSAPASPQAGSTPSNDLSPTGTANDVPRSATPALTIDPLMKFSSTDSAPGTPTTGTSPASPQFKSATGPISRSGSGLSIGSAAVSTSSTKSPVSPTTAPESAKFAPSSPTATSSTGSLSIMERLATAASSVTATSSAPASPASSTTPSSAESRSWVRSAFPRPTLSNSLSELPTMSATTPPPSAASPAPSTPSASTSSSESAESATPEVAMIIVPAQETPTEETAPSSPKASAPTASTPEP